MDELKEVGFDESMGRAASFLVEDDEVKRIKKKEKIEIMPIEDAKDKYGKLFFKVVDKNKDKYTRLVHEKGQTGYFIRVPSNMEIMLPIQTAFLLKSNGFKQILHNVVILEENAKLHIISGCTSMPNLKGMHDSVTEFYLKKNSYLTYTMIHRWTKETEVYPRTGAMLDENSTFISNYIALTPAKIIESYPVAILNKNAIARFYSILYAREKSKFDVGAIAKLNGEGAKAEIISRIISDNSNVISRGLIEGNANNSKGHMECSGLIIKNGIIHTIPELKSSVENVDLSHEAAIGKIAQEQLNYLMARGIEEEEAKSLLIRGFLDVSIKGLPPHLNKVIAKVIDLKAKATA